MKNITEKGIENIRSPQVIKQIGRITNYNFNMAQDNNIIAIKLNHNTLTGKTLVQ